jgi:hypothetical protein
LKKVIKNHAKSETENLDHLVKVQKTKVAEDELLIDENQYDEDDPEFEYMMDPVVIHALRKKK